MTRRHRQRVFRFTIAACVLFVLFTIIAMTVYPAYRQDGVLRHYRFWGDYLSELGETRTPAGDPKTFSMMLFVFSMTLAGSAMVAYYWTIPGLFRSGANIVGDRKTGRKTKVEAKQRSGLRLINNIRTSTFGTLRIAGTICGIGFLGVGFIPRNIAFELHNTMVYIGFTGFLVAALLNLLLILLQRDYPRVYAFVYVLFCLILGTYLFLLYTRPDIPVPQGFKLQVVAQKLVAYSAIVAMLIEGVGALRYETRLAARGGELRRHDVQTGKMRERDASAGKERAPEE